MIAALMEGRTCRGTYFCSYVSLFVSVFVSVLVFASVFVFDQKHIDGGEDL